MKGEVYGKRDLPPAGMDKTIWLGKVEILQVEKKTLIKVETRRQRK
jgi:hypothetical protein